MIKVKQFSKLIMEVLEENELASETSNGKPNAPFRVGIYAPNGTGKSTFCSQCEGVYFLPTEEGVNDIKVPQYKSQIRSLPLLYDVLKKLRDKKHPYKAVCLDSASATEALIIDAIEDRLRKSSSKAKTISDLNDDFGSGYLAIANEWKVILSKFDELRDKRNMNILITANCKTEKVDNLEGKDYSKYNIDLFGSRSTKVITSWLDHCLFAKEEVSVAVDKKKVLAFKGNLSLYTRSSSTWFAKTRGEIPWPEKLPLDWNVFNNLRQLIVNYGKNIGNHLEDEFSKVLPSLPNDDKEKAGKAFKAFIDAEKWHLAYELIQQAKEDSVTEKEDEDL